MRICLVASICEGRGQLGIRAQSTTIIRTQLLIFGVFRTSVPSARPLLDLALHPCRPASHYRTSASGLALYASSVNADLRRLPHP